MRMHFQDSIDDKLSVERLLNSSIVPYALGAREKMAQLYYAFTTFDDYSILSLVEIMKNRVQLYQLMRSLIESVESNSPRIASDSNQVATYLLEPTKAGDFVKALVELLKV